MTYSTARQLRADRKSLAASARRREQAAMTPVEIDRRIVKAILDADNAARPLERRELIATNVPPSSIDERFAACMDIAEQLSPGLKKRTREFA